MPLLIYSVPKTKSRQMTPKVKRQRKRKNAKDACEGLILNTQSVLFAGVPNFKSID